MLENIYQFCHLTGLVLYPKNTNHKNIVLLVCESCFGYESGKGTQHAQLSNWYYGIYGESKEFTLISGFYQRNGKLGFNSVTFNFGGKYGNGTKEMESLEMQTVEIVVRGKLESYTP